MPAFVIEEPAQRPAHNPPESQRNVRAAVLAEAGRLVNGERNFDYGDPIADFARTAEFWTTYLSSTRGLASPLDAHDVAALMALLKISRIAWSPDKEDHWVDLAGYAACGADCVAREEPRS